MIDNKVFYFQISSNEKITSSFAKNALISCKPSCFIMKTVEANQQKKHLILIVKLLNLLTKRAGSRMFS